MSLVKSLAYVLILAGIGVLLNGKLIDVGIILLIEGGVLLTLVEENRKQDRRSRDRSV
jgi:Zn-dependent membrane protease YugP